MKTAFLALVCFCFFISPAFGQWERTAGPENYRVTQLATVDSFQVAVTGEAKVFNRPTGSLVWAPASGIPPASQVNFVRQTTSSAFVRDLTANFYRTKDGINWSPLVYTGPGLALSDLFAFGDTLFAKAWIIGTSPYQFKLLRSTDDGDSWIDATPSTSMYELRRITKEGAYYRIYARNQPGYGNSQVHQSLDGLTWTLQGQSQYVPGVEFAGRQFYFPNPSTGSFEYSENGGATWSGTQYVLKPEGISSAVFKNDQALFACFIASYRRVQQIYRTYDGVNWTALSNLPSLYERPYLHGNTLYAIGDFNQLYASVDNGDTWLPVGNSLPADFKLLGMAFDMGKPLAFGIDGIYSSDANGTFGMPDQAGIPAEAFHISDIVEHQGQLIAGGEGLFRSKNHGDSWEKINNGTARLPYIFFDESLLFSSGSQLMAGGSGLLHHSYDAGNTWEPTATTPVWRDEHGSFAVLTGLDDTLFASKLDSNLFNIYRSYDGGNTWAKITPNNLSGGWGVYYAGGKLILRKKSDSGSMKVSNDHGNTWQNYSSGVFTGFRSFAYTNGQYYAGGFAPNPADKRILRSNDALNWQQIVFDTLPGQFTATDLLAEDSLVVVATEYQGIFLSSDWGLTWSNITAGEPGIYRVFALEMDSLYLYAGTERGIWRRALTSLTTNTKNAAHAQAQPVKVSPNPAAQSITIDLSSPTRDANPSTILALFDVKGRKILERPYQNGDQLSVAAYSPGVYFISITAGAVSWRGKFVKI